MRALTATLCVIALVGCGPDLRTPGPRSEIRVERAPQAMAPMMGGALLVTQSGRYAVASDPHGDALHVVDLTTKKVRRIALPRGSRPNRMTEDSRGDVRVVLRGTGQLATVSLTTFAVEGTRSICPEPRGVSWDALRASVQVACASGHLVSVPLEGSSTSRFVAVDLRDVVPVGGKLLATTFREGLLLDATGPEAVVLNRLPDFERGDARFRGGVAWRAVAGPGDTLLVTHQRERLDDLGEGPAMPAASAPATGAYGIPGAPFDPSAPCDSGPAVRSAVTMMDATGAILLSAETGGVLPVDLSAAPDGTMAVTANPGNQLVDFVPLARGTSGCTTQVAASPPAPAGSLAGVAFTPAGQLVSVSFSPPVLSIHAGDGAIEQVALSDVPAPNPGNTLFHAAAPAGLACASCHPEGGDDGHVWTVAGKARRSQSLQGGVTASAPFHWQGEHRTLASLMADTFVSRMSGPPPDSSTVDALGDWLDSALPRLQVVSAAPASQLAEGRRAFEAAGCASCHAGARLTNDTTVDVGTGGAFQVPSLAGLSLRAPFMHDGCAKDLEARFADPVCGGGAKHGDVSKLSAPEREALLAYLASL
ncbi:MAG: hypothetical protein AB1938_02115 [Myxococcota bacterium]